jgi:hypothetical protein
MARLEPKIFFSVGIDDDHYTTPPGPFLTLWHSATCNSTLERRPTGKGQPLPHFSKASLTRYGL